MKVYIKEFIETMKEKSGFLFYDFAGFEKVDPNNCEMITKKISVEENEIIIRDLRGSNNFYKIDNELYLEQLDVGIPYTTEAPLLARFYWIVKLFIDKKDIYISDLMEYWQKSKQINEIYKNEKKTFKDDPFLALYWLFHFGFVLDKRFEEVRQIVKKYNLNLQLNFIDIAIEFFEESDENFTFEIDGDRSLFLQRRAFLLFSTYSYQNNANEDNFEFWWKSISIFPKYSKYHLAKIYFLKKNIDDFYKWDFINIISKEEKNNIDLVSYINAFNPYLENNQEYVETFLNELKDFNETIFIDDYQFIIFMLWEVKDYVSNKQLLKEVLNIYFTEDMSSSYSELARKYSDIEKVIKDKTINPKKINKELAKPKIKKFIDRMKIESSTNFCEFAGCTNLFLSDEEVRGRNISPESGDWVVNDIRGNSGIYGISHEDGKIYKVKLSSKASISVSKNEEKKLSVDAKTLMYRYYWMWEVIVDGYKHRVKPNPYTNWEDVKKLNIDYKKEKKTFKDDAYLALYWLLHFGFSFDKRFEEVKQISNEYNLSSKVKFMDTAIDFFEESNENFSYEIKDDEELFLRRRAFLVFITQSYEYRGDEDNFQAWWKSLTIHPKCEPYSLRRVRWLRNNLLKFDKWNEFDSIKSEDKENIELLSYVYVCNPNVKHKDKYADNFLEELKKNKKTLIKNDKKFAQRMIWDIRAYVTNKELLKEVSKHYFKGDTLEEEYQDIKKVLKEECANFEECNRIKAELCSFSKNFKEIDLLLSKLESDIIYEVVNNLDQKNTNEKMILKRCFHYIFTHDLPNKKEILIDLYNRIDASKDDLKNDIFFKKYPNIIKDENDSNLQIAMEFVKSKENGFLGCSKEASMYFFKNIAHLPKVFNFFIEVFLNPKYDDKYTKEYILSEIFDDKKIKKKLSKEQIEILLDGYIAFLVKNANIDYENNLNQAIKSVCCNIRCIENSLAKQWLEQRYNNKKWLTQFKEMKIFIDEDKTMAEEINSELESALELLEK